MSFIIEFIKGILICFGIIVGFMIFASQFVKLMRKGDNTYYAGELIEPFSKYLLVVQQDEKYEEIPIVESIINALKNNYVPEEAYSYIIKKDVYLYTSDENGHNAFKIGKKYIISGKKAGIK